MRMVTDERDEKSAVDKEFADCGSHVGSFDEDKRADWWSVRRIGLCRADTPVRCL